MNDAPIPTPIPTASALASMVALGRALVDRLPPFQTDPDTTLLGQAAIHALRLLLATPSLPLPGQGCLIALQQLVHWPEFTAVLLEAVAGGRPEAVVPRSGPVAAASDVAPGCPDPIAWAAASPRRQRLEARCQDTFQAGLVAPLLAFCVGAEQAITARAAADFDARSLPSAVMPAASAPLARAARPAPVPQLRTPADRDSGTGSDSGTAGRSADPDPRERNQGDVEGRRGLAFYAGIGLAALVCLGMGWLGYLMALSFAPSASGPNAFEALETDPGARSDPLSPLPPLEPTRRLQPNPVSARSPQGINGGRLVAAPSVAPRCLAGEQPEVVAAADPSNFGPREGRDWQGKPVASTPALIVLHETVVDEPTALALFQRRNAADAQQASYHVLIGRDGRRLRVVPDAMRAYGAGDSRFQGLEQQLRRGVPASVNNIALHVSLVSPPDGADGEARGHAGYTAAQYRSLARQVALWQSSYGIGAERVVTHQEVDNSGSRRDPRSFDWGLLAREHRSQMQACSRTPLATPGPQAARSLQGPGSSQGTGLSQGTALPQGSALP